jgi:hypothetical protein
MTTLVVLLEETLVLAPEKETVVILGNEGPRGAKGSPGRNGQDGAGFDTEALDTALATKADLDHDHAIADVTGLQTALDGKQPLITDLNELIDDRVAALLVQGANITLSYDDTTGQLTVTGAASGGASISQGTTPPGSPTAGKLWHNTENNGLYIYYDDGTSSQWVLLGFIGSSLNTYSSKLTSGSYTFANSPTPATANIITSIVVPASTIARKFLVSGVYNTNSGTGSSSGLSVGLDSSSVIATTRMLPLIDGSYGFGLMGSIGGVIVDIPGDGSAHTIQLYGGQFGGGSGFTVTTAYASLVAVQI